MKLRCFAHHNGQSHKIYDDGSDWVLAAQGSVPARYFSKWSTDLSGSLARAQQAAGTGLDWVDVSSTQLC